MGLINLFRFLDFWIGIPLCLLLMPIQLLRRLWVCLFVRDLAPIKKILIIKISELGAVIHTYPLLKKIKEDYPSAKIYILSFFKSKEIFEILDENVNFEQVITIREDGLLVLIKDAFRALILLSRLKIDVTIDLEFFTRASAIFTFFSWARTTVGFYPYSFEGLYRGDFLTHKVFYNPLKHVTVNYLSLMQALKLKSKDSPEVQDFIDERLISFPGYKSMESVRQSLSVLGVPLGKHIFFMNAGEGMIPLREWPVENFLQVAREILIDEKNVILLVGTVEANTKAEHLARSLNHERIKNYCGKTNVRQLLELFLMGHALITNDGGLAHLAMLTPIKKFVFFGPETPLVFAPLGRNTHIIYSHWPCSPCLSALNHRSSSCRNNRCLSSIHPDQVMDIINDF